MQCYASVLYDWLWVCDSNIFVNKYTLSELSSHCAPDVGIIHQLPYITTRPGFASALEKVGVIFECVLVNMGRVLTRIPWALRHNLVRVFYPPM